MTMDSNSSGGAKGFQDLVKRFWGFDHMIGSALIKIIYYIGLFAILIGTVLAMFGGGFALGLGGGGAAMFIIAPVLGIVYLVFWRFICEMWLLMFLMYNRMGEIRDRLPPR